MKGGRHGSWQARELDRIMSKQAGKAWPEHRCATLSNPAAERGIDGIILEELWPGVGQALQGSGFTALTGDDGATPSQALEPLRREFTTRALTFVIEDPNRPAVLRAWKPWYCRFVIQASIEHHFLDKTTLLSFPEDFDLSRLTRLLQEPLMQGCPPELSWYEGFDGSGMYSIRISYRRGSELGRTEKGCGARVHPQCGGRPPAGHRGHGPSLGGLERRCGVQRGPSAGHRRERRLLKRGAACTLAPGRRLSSAMSARRAPGMGTPAELAQCLYVASVGQRLKFAREAQG